MGRPTCGQGQPRHLQPMAQTLSRQHPLWTCSSQACGAARMQHFCLGFASKPRDQTRVAAASGVTLEQGDAAAAGPCLCIIVCSAACTGSKACVWVVTTGCGHLCVDAAVYLGLQTLHVLPVPLPMLTHSRVQCGGCAATSGTRQLTWDILLQRVC